MIKYSQITVTAGNGIKRGPAIEKEVKRGTVILYNTWHLHLKISKHFVLINEGSISHSPARLRLTSLQYVTAIDGETEAGDVLWHLEFRESISMQPGASQEHLLMNPTPTLGEDGSVTKSAWETRWWPSCFCFYFF